MGNSGVMRRPPVLGQQSFYDSKVQVVASCYENMERTQVNSASWGSRHHSNSPFGVSSLSPREGLRALTCVLLSREMTSHQDKDLINTVISKGNLLILGILFLPSVSFLFPHPPPNRWLKASSLEDPEGNASLFFPCLPSCSKCI